MKKAICMAVALLSVAVGNAQAAGFLIGAAVGAVAGHVAGHHPVAGAIVGCAVGHHMAKEQKRKDAEERAAAQMR
ncbi:hypothetical protein [Paraburkholderia flagellata]|uniref:hypothetical protein n=1 Tax=Paraburkholderia flagellata TaxID=2883241 RepID=UPI001F251D2D|nr:hypothetical protein [Paraburkholderia flagellata]